MSETQGKTMTPEEFLRHMAGQNTADMWTPSVIAAAALHIREGLDKLAKAERRAGKTSRMSTAIREAIKDT